MDDLIDVIGEMFRKVYNGTDNNVSKSFPREYFTTICDIVGDIDELNYHEEFNINCNISVSYNLCFVKFIRTRGNFFK